MTWYDDYITSVEGVQGGAPIIRGTRTPVLTVALLAREVYPNDPDEVQASLPHLTATQIQAALAYYEDHTAEIRADLERHEQALLRARVA